MQLQEDRSLWYTMQSMKHEKEKKRRKRILLESIRTAVATLLLLAISLLTFAWFHHARPKQRMSAGLVTVTPTPAAVAQALEAQAAASLATPAPSDVPPLDDVPATPEPTPVYISWIEKYADQFTPTIVSNEQGYTSPDVAIHISKVQYGKAKTAMYYLADIYLTDVFQLETVLAKDTFGRGLRESVKEMGQRSGALLAITGDTYGNQDAGIVIRNGIVHRQEKSEFDVCVLYYDGTMRTFSPQDFSLEQAIADGAYQAWTFGPMLLDEQGQPIPDQQLNTSKNIRRANPRAGVGYYEPGHYCFVVVDGRTDDASGLTLEQFSQLFADLGCRAAYNMDGGRSAEMYYAGSILNDPYKGGRSVSDCLIIRETFGKEP